jgi:hypothetical protein
MMKSLFTTPALFADTPDVLYFFQCWALKIRNEAVVEGMGSHLHAHADPQSGLNAISIAQETFVHFNGPRLDKANNVIEEALNHHFGPGKPWPFTHISEPGQNRRAASPCKVLSEPQGEA